MKKSIYFIDRKTGEIKEEKIYFEKSLRFLYGANLGRFFIYFVVKPLFSKLFGWWQTLFFTKRKIAPFVKKYELDPSEFEKPLTSYRSFNAFFTRKLKPSARPLSEGMILPADGRYLFYQNIDKCDGFVVKGKKFDIYQLIKNEDIAKKYTEASMVIARLCPTDYHRFHFPCNCLPEQALLINGPLYSVNPLSLQQRIEILAENKRMLTTLKTKNYGEILFIEIGATMVGSIHQTYTPYKYVKKGDEKGYFSFGGSSLILLFQKGSIQIAEDLLRNSQKHLETLCFFGQPLEHNSCFW